MIQFLTILIVITAVILTFGVDSELERGRTCSRVFVCQSGVWR